MSSARDQTLREMGHARKVVIVVFCHEINHIDHSHRLLQSRMDGCAGEEFFIELLESSHELHAGGAECVHDGLNRPLIVLRLPRFLIRDVGGAERFRIGKVIVEPRIMQLIEVVQMADMFLD